VRGGWSPTKVRLPETRAYASVRWMSWRDRNLRAGHSCGAVYPATQTAQQSHCYFMSTRLLCMSLHRFVLKKGTRLSRNLGRTFLPLCAFRCCCCGFGDLRRRVMLSIHRSLCRNLGGKYAAFVDDDSALSENAPHRPPVEAPTPALAQNLHNQYQEFTESL
jgi:hypothetical protein